jgi:hypothetical protein
MKRAGRAAACLLGFLVLVLLGSFGAPARAALPPTPSCTDAQTLAEDATAVPGDVTREFVECLGELLAVQRTLLEGGLVERQTTVLTTFLSIHAQVSTTLISEITNAVGQITPADIDAFESALRRSRLLEEIGAMQSLLAVPSTPFPGRVDKLNALNVLLGSLKDTVITLLEVIGIKEELIEKIKTLAETVLEELKSILT